MKEIKFNSNGDPLKVSIKVDQGVIAASYWLKLSKKDSNETVMKKVGDNMNPQDDTYFLPGIAKDNEGRILTLGTDFYGLDIAKSKKFKILLQVFQGDALLDAGTDEGDITGKGQTSLIFVKLII